jgi:hypothetical protein
MATKLGLTLSKQVDLDDEKSIQDQFKENLQKDSDDDVVPVDETEVAECGGDCEGCDCLEAAGEEEADSVTPRKPRRLVQLTLTVNELTHIRDMLSIKLPPHLQQSVSQALAVREGRRLSEASLWQKVTTACESVDVEVGDGAPDFIVGAVTMAEIGVFEVSPEPIENYHDQGDSDDNDDGEEVEETEEGPFGGSGD